MGLIVGADISCDRLLLYHIFQAYEWLEAI